eukprot:TRINITY_DN7165_c0_g1_i2.p1 TRINITY_DN7165_c0_g1~~TRINITY_DN7165_c0_g1_i2.p1  ORF type:complete len:275 (+),score=59.98 TRINITY_DN7165_c0_g1_i2:28-825(+)
MAILELPDDILEHIVSFCEPIEIAKLARCCTQLRNVTEQDSVWLAVAMRRFYMLDQSITPVKLAFQQYSLIKWDPSSDVITEQNSRGHLNIYSRSADQRLLTKIAHDGWIQIQVAEPKLERGTHTFHFRPFLVTDDIDIGIICENFQWTQDWLRVLGFAVWISNPLIVDCAPDKAPEQIVSIRAKVNVSVDGQVCTRVVIVLDGEVVRWGDIRAPGGVYVAAAVRNVGGFVEITSAVEADKRGNLKALQEVDEEELFKEQCNLSP